MDKGVLSFKNAKPIQEFINEIFALDIRTLDTIDDRKVSQYASALAQYLIYFRSQQNEARAEAFRLNKTLELSTTQLLTIDILKQYKTKKDAMSYLIANTKELFDLDEKIENLKIELMLIEDIDKSIQEYIATFKRELTRRENELWEIRRERSH